LIPLRILVADDHEIVRRGLVQLLAEGKNSKEVATHLDLSAKTVETHRSNIMRKLNLHSVAELVLYAVKNHMVQVASPPAVPHELCGVSCPGAPVG
jgi:DNA-binding NarL/FixJ family response regulator